MLTKITTNTVAYNFNYDKFNNLQSVQIGTSTPLITNTYGITTDKNGNITGSNGNLIESQYANGDKVKYTYDSLDRLIETKYTNDSDAQYARYTHSYNSKNQLMYTNNGSEGLQTYYTYDLSGRLIEKSRSDGAYIRTAFDTRNLTTGVTYSFGGLTEKATYSYDLTKDNALSETTFTDNSKFGIEYDALGRVTSEKSISSEGFFANVAFYTYTNRASNPIYTSGLVSRISYSRINDTLSYTYDKLGNITSVTHADGTKETYTYDALSRLVRVDSQVNNETVVYTYDNSGNIHKKIIYAYTSVESLDASTPLDTINYYYSNADWKDKLTHYDGTAITYDELGNPLTYGSNTYTWNGRRMETYSNGTKTASYKYDENGVRTSKTVNGTKTSFFVDGTTILAQKAGNIKIPFYYDGNGKRIAFKYGGSMYFYVYNLQGDVTHILDDDANIVGTYTYDAWGKITNLSSLTSIAQTNPFRYRGYYYDTESGLYYLNSRYYNPEWGRFISADGYVSTGQGLTGYKCGELFNQIIKQKTPT